MVSKNYMSHKDLKKKEAQQKLLLEKEERTKVYREHIEKTFKKGELLDMNYPVNWDYMYYADDKWIRSDIQGTVRQLIHDLNTQGYKCENIYACRCR